jgi:CheY-like chemotaxis protein
MNGNPAVLVVEDEQDSRDSLQEWLELEGYRVATAANGREALAWLAAHDGETCVVLLDLVMPVVDGWQVYEALRVTGRLATTKVLVTTSAPHRAPEGATVLAKPLDLDALVAAIGAVCPGMLFGGGAAKTM